jgi:hypothetical protein
MTATTKTPEQIAEALARLARREDADSERFGFKHHFAEVVYAIAAALRAERESGKAEGIEEAARAVEDEGPFGNCSTGCREMGAEVIRALASRGGGQSMSAPEPTAVLGDDGYPTEAALECVRKWSYKDPAGMLAFVRSLWAYAECGYWSQQDAIYEVSTAGWSGNEDLIGAMRANRMFWTLCWLSSRRGGHYEFEIPAALRGDIASRGGEGK